MHGTVLLCQDGHVAISHSFSGQGAGEHSCPVCFIEVGMNAPEIERFYTSRAWAKCRACFLADRGGLCEMCLKKGLIEPATQVHHKIHITLDNVNDPTITLNHDNLMALCDACHHEQHQKKRWRCDALGHVAL